MTDTPENRMTAYLKACGWQGGTIHQIADELGCDSTALLYGNPKDDSLTSDSASGWFTGRTCSIEHIRKAIKTRHGNLEFWLGYAQGQCV